MVGRKVILGIGIVNSRLDAIWKIFCVIPLEQFFVNPFKIVSGDISYASATMQTILVKI